jgi:putative transposase
VDTMGLLLLVVVHSAGIQDRDGAKLVLLKIAGLFPRLQLIWADGGYAGALVQWTAALTRWVLEIVKRTDDLKGFVVLPRRWVVERTLAWLGHYRRLARDYEFHANNSEAWVYIAMIHVMVRRLEPSDVPNYGRRLKPS